MDVAPIKAMVISTAFESPRARGSESEVARTGIRWSEKLVAQIQERLMVGGLGTEALVYGIRG